MANATVTLDLDASPFHKKLDAVEKRLKSIKSEIASVDKKTRRKRPPSRGPRFTDRDPGNLSYR